MGRIVVCTMLSIDGYTDYRGALTYWPDQFDNADAHPADRYIAERYANWNRNDGPRYRHDSRRLSSAVCATGNRTDDSSW
jgi:hypothetical protein